MATAGRGKKHEGAKALSLFSGCGGFCEGMKLAGFDVAAAVELDRFACQTYRANFPEVHLYEGDVADFASMELLRLQNEFRLHDTQVVFGGPPCQGYSQIGTRDLADPRNKLYLQFTRVLRKLRPAVFAMENVPNMLLLRGGIFRDKALAEFTESGYSRTGYVVLDASEYGVPQQRRRVFYVGVRDDLPFGHEMSEFIRQTAARHVIAGRPTVWDAIGDLPVREVESGETLAYPRRPAQPSAFLNEMRIESDGRWYSSEYKTKTLRSHFSDTRLHNHHTKKIQARRKALIKLLAPGAKADSLPKEIWNGKRPEKWRRLHPDRPAHTLLAQMHRDLSEFVHPVEQRWITVREALRLQSFHDGFVPRSSEWQMLKQIGNAVPPLLGRVVGQIVDAVLDEVGAKKMTNRSGRSKHKGTETGQYSLLPSV